jgi:hypothetical protein
MNLTQTVRHLVLCRFKEGTRPDQIQVFVDAFRRLKDLIPGVLSFEHGANASPEGLNRGMTYANLITFEDAAARDAYLPHPEHRRFVAEHTGILAEVQVLDYVPLD